MPWKDTQMLDERMSFILAYRQGEESLSEVCRRYGVSRKTGRKWIQRYRESGPEGLGDRSRAPHHHPNAAHADIVSTVIKAKLEHPTWGPRKLISWFRRWHPEVEMPAPSTAGEILRRHGLVRPRKRVRRTDPWTRPFGECTAPNETWCIDFKGWFRTQDGKRCDPLTISDAYSRQLLCCRGLESQKGQGVRSAMERVFREYGLPATIRSDNGTPFASTALGGLSRLSAWWNSGSSPNVSGRDTRKRTVVMNVCTAPSRQKPSLRPGPASALSRRRSIASGGSTTRNGRTRGPWAESPCECLPAI